MRSKLKGFPVPASLHHVYLENSQHSHLSPDSKNTLHSCEEYQCSCCFVKNVANGSTNQQFPRDAHSASLEFCTAWCLIICRGLFLSQAGTRVTGDAPALRHCRARSTTRHPNYSDSTSRGEVKIWLLPPGWASLLPPPSFDLTLIPSHSPESAQVGGLFPGWAMAAPRTDSSTLNYPWAPWRANEEWVRRAHRHAPTFPHCDTADWTMKGSLKTFGTNSFAP